MFYRFVGMTSLALNSKLELYNFVKSDQNATKLWTRLFFYTINKNVT